MLQQSILYWNCCGFPQPQLLIDRLVPYASLIAAGIAVIGGIIAIGAINAQKTIARKRASIDFFLKTDLDQSMLELYQGFRLSAEAVTKKIKAGASIDDLEKLKSYRTVRTYLNIHELLAVGIKNRVFDEKTCYHYWSGIMVHHCEVAKEIIDFSRKDIDDASAYWDMLKLKEKWKKKISRWSFRQALWRKINGVLSFAK